MKHYTTLFIDLDNTLYDFTGNSREAYSAVYELLGYDRWFEDFEHYYAIYEEYNLQLWALYAEGKIKGIGLSNFLPHHLDNILNNAKVMPLVNQLEVHPGYSQEAAVAYCKSKNIWVQAWSPLGRSNVLQHPILRDMAEKYNKSVAQLCLRFLLQKQIIPLVKASSMERMKENMDIFDFEISAEDLSILEYMPQDMWQKEHPDFAIPKAKSNFEQ